MDQSNHLQRIIEWFDSKVIPKYKRGQEEHGGNLWLKGGMLSAIKEEVVDLVVYVQTLEEQLGRFPEAHKFFTGEERLPANYQYTLSTADDNVSEVFTSNIDGIPRSPESRTRKKPRIYVAGPYTAPTDHERYCNIEAARSYARDLWEMGAAVLCPHSNTAFMDGPGITPQDFIDGDLEWIAVSDAIYMLSNWHHSKGAIQEKQFAVDRGITVLNNLAEARYFIKEFNDVH